jgi:Flp pilus assembly pilin Flp
MFRNIMNNQRGATEIEYALLISLIAIASTGSFTAVGDGINATLTAAANALGVGLT